jgi:hypothetical protein
MNKEYKWIIIKEIGTSTSGKTKVFVVLNKDYQDAPLGFIKWYGGYRKYAYFPEAESYYEEDCLKNIADFLEGLKNEKTKIKVSKNNKL